jgi:hypothetical protein
MKNGFKRLKKGQNLFTAKAPDLFKLKNKTNFFDQKAKLPK